MSKLGREARERSVLLVETGSVVIVGAALGFVTLAWLRRWWAWTTRLVVTVPIVVLLIVPVLLEQLWYPAPPTQEVGVPAEYPDVYTPVRGTAGSGTGLAESLVRTAGPGTLYVAFTCRGDGEAAMQLDLGSGLQVSQDCVWDETRELREWIKLEQAEEFRVGWASPDQVRGNYVVQFLAPAQQ